ncbi:MAG: serine hydrolase domain-containing protein [Chloroflexota bacterium]
MPSAEPESVGLDPATLGRIDALINKNIAADLFPGAVVLVTRRGAVVKETAYGNAAVYVSEGERLREPIPTTISTIYDMASLTKLFTTTAALVLVDRGKLDLDARVADYLPEFGTNGKEKVTVRQLLTHTSGLPAGLKLWTKGDTVEQRLQAAYSVGLEYEPGTKYLYSDAGPIILGKVIERIAGQSLDRFIDETIIRPLGLADTMYLPPWQLQMRVAATEVRSPGHWGVVWARPHDGEAEALGGVAGNAGLFATASDLAVFAQMMLEGGAYGGVRVISEPSAKMAVQPQPGWPGHGLGWELDQDWYMGDLALATTYGHTGYTGTSIVIDPDEELTLILLTNRVHPHATGSANKVRKGVADLVAESIRD